MPLGKPDRLQVSGAVGRADLLRALALLGKDALPDVALLAGYAKAVPPVEVPRAAPLRIQGHGPTIEIGPPSSEPAPISRPSVRYWAVVQREERPAPARPDWLERAKVPEANSASWRARAYRPLVPWMRMGTALRIALGVEKQSRQPDMQEVLRLICTGRPMVRIPVISRLAWASQVCVVSDVSKHLWTYYPDFDEIASKLESLRGRAAVHSRCVLDIFAADRYQSTDHGVGNWRGLNPNVPMLILGDLGMLDPRPGAVDRWLHFGSAWRRMGLTVHALCPVPAERVPPALANAFMIHEWDKGARVSKRIRAEAVSPLQGSDEASTLLTCMAPALSVNRTLLRELRETARCHAVLEADIQRHADIQAQGLRLYWRETVERVKWRESFGRLSVEQKRNVAESYRRHHAGLPALLTAELEFIDATLGRESDVPRTAQEQDEREAGKAYREGLVKLADESAPNAFVNQAFLGGYVPVLGDEVIEKDNALRAIKLLDLTRKVGGQDKVELPEWANEPSMRYFLGIRQTQEVPGRLVQRGITLQIEPAGARLASGAVLADCVVSANRISTTIFRTQDSNENSLQDSRGTVGVGVVDGAVNRIEVDLGAEKLRLEPVDHRLRGLPIRRDGTGLWLEVSWLGRVHRFQWRDASAGTPGYWDIPPPMGIDTFGLFAEFSVRGTRQRCRWIEPGVFLMGSPDAERERASDENRHEVRVTRGLWLAESACTQALWEAVMGSNPSRFKGMHRNPVENVSWDDVVNDFLPRLNALVPGLEAGLPSEAQWEYACRAGTDTPFSFGDNITPDQVNYDGNYPYRGTGKGVYRKTTVPVGSLPANAWGLYEMHGNVFEWCSDWYGEYPERVSEDPEGPAEGAARVLRGGSWLDLARRCRSAFRFASVPGRRFVPFGFRLAPGRAGRVGTTGPAEPAAQAKEPGRGTRPGFGGLISRVVDGGRDLAKKPKRKK